MSNRRRTLVAALTLGGVTISGLAVPRTVTFSSILRTPHEEIAVPPHDGPVDFNGNDVRQAIARYKVDPAGALYEEHSPDTELPRLGSPKG